MSEAIITLRDTRQGIEVTCTMRGQPSLAQQQANMLLAHLDDLADAQGASKGGIREMPIVEVLQ